MVFQFNPAHLIRLALNSLLFRISVMKRIFITYSFPRKHATLFFGAIQIFEDSVVNRSFVKCLRDNRSFQSWTTQSSRLHQQKIIVPKARHVCSCCWRKHGFLHKFSCCSQKILVNQTKGSILKWRTQKKNNFALAFPNRDILYNDILQWPRIATESLSFSIKRLQSGHFANSCIIFHVAASCNIT